MVRPRTYPVWRAHQVKNQLGGRDMAILGSLFRVRLLTTAQVQRLHIFEGSPLTRLRRTQGVLRRLSIRHLVVRLPRVFGGRRAGAPGFIYALSGLGRAVLDDDAPGHSRPVWKTTGRFQNHMLEVSELYVGLREVERQSQGQRQEQTSSPQDETVTLLAFDGEPKCWRHFTGIASELVMVKPDAYVSVRIGRLVLSAFVEVDMGTESLPTIQKKSERYVAYWHSGMEQQRTRTEALPHGLFPYVVWLVPDEQRRTKIEMVVGRLAVEARKLFRVGLIKDGVHDLLGLLRTGTVRSRSDGGNTTARGPP